MTSVYFVKRNCKVWRANRGMSHSFRQPIGAQSSVPVAQTPLPGRMVAPICTTGSPAVFPVMPNAYSLLQQQPQQYMAQPVVYPQTLSNVQSRVPFVATVPASVPRMFVPGPPVSTGMSSSTPDPAKLLEEQRRLEKERNFQLQQERLKQFTVAGKKSSINADNLIDSMFGKFQHRKTTPSSQTFPSTKINEINEEEKRPKTAAFEGDKLKYLEPSVLKPDVATSILTTVPVKKDRKELDSMMLECSNLTAPSKALKFHKPSVKEITPLTSHGTTFTASEKARDWRNLQGLDQVFTAPKPRFPNWCHREKVPELYKKVEAIVTNNDIHAPNTNLLFPILMSSGLSRELLGQIWELINESASGQLTVEEMYAALALIAIAQAGHAVKTIDVLNQVPSCPIPHLNFFTNPSDANALEGHTVSETSQQSKHQIVRPSAIALTNNRAPSNDFKDAENIAMWTPFEEDSLNPPEVEFDDFKCATPTAINFSLGTPPIADDEFDDFKQAPCVKVSQRISVKTETSEMPKRHNKVIQQDLMSPEEDKYSVFRSLQENEANSQWGDFTFSSRSNDSCNVLSTGKETDNKEDLSNIKCPSVLVTENTDSPNLLKMSSTNIEKEIREEDDFGDFIHASVRSTPSFSTVTDFADFSNFKSTDYEQVCSPSKDEEFGEFTSSVSVPLKPELGQDFLFCHLKDNISLAESQSVSSLELGTFDGGGGHSGESKSSLSRQGSIPSLDLKGVSLDLTDSEDCFGEIQLSPFVPSPSPKGSEENESSSNTVGLVFQSSSLPHPDKYSVIRQEKAKEEDQHVSCWIRCLESAVNILQSTKKIFNQMSCSSVCNEVLTSEEGGNYVKNVIEVYKVICRIGLVSKAVGKQTGGIFDLLNEADQAWNTICGFFAGSVLMPEESSLDFSSGVLRPEHENNAKACGLCLLNIELRSKSFKQEDCPKLSYGGRNYHSTCANLWVNCVDPLLPALMLPQLL